MSTPAFGRRGSTGTFADTVPEKSAEQAMLLKQDEIIDRINAVVAALAIAADVPAINAAAAALASIVKVVLVP